MSGIYEHNPTTYTIPSADYTVASAWSSSPLGHPADETGYSPERHGLPPCPIAPAAKPKSISKAALAAALAGTIGVGAALGMAIFIYTSPTQLTPVTVVPGSTGALAADPTAAAPAQVVTPPDDGAAPAQVVTPPDTGAAPAQVITPPDTGAAPAQVITPPDNSAAPAQVVTPPDTGAAAADPGSLPVQSGPVVVVNAPPPPSLSRNPGGFQCPPLCGPQNQPPPHQTPPPPPCKPSKEKKCHNVGGSG
jgi:hypothetical protein